MTITKKQEADILRYFHSEKWKVGTISKQLHVNHNTVQRVLAEAGVPRSQRVTRRSIVDDYIPFMVETLTKFPKLTASRLYAMVRERGYTGGEDYFRHIVAQYRPRPLPEAFHRLKTLPAEQAQVDWAHMGSKSDWSYLALADEIRRASNHPEQDLQELFARMCFNALVSNLDDHPRNHAILAKDTHWRLSPAYDLTPMPSVSPCLQ